MSDWRPPDTFDEYRLLHPIGRGAMGQVYLGHDVLLDRPVAVKFIATSEPSDAVRQRFLIEARAIARLQHPNVVCVYRAGEVAGRPFIVSEYVRGRTLNRTPKPVSWRRALRIGIGLARGLAAAHRQGVLHRDIKPSNAMLTEDGEVKLLDFGVAKLVSLLPVSEPEPHTPGPPAPRHPAARRPLRAASASPLTQAGALLGTPLYMAPEVQEGAPATRQSDVYSLGVVVYELCTGRTPGQGLDMGSATLDLRGPRAELPGREERWPLLEMVPGIDPQLSMIIERCLQDDPALRFDSGEELREALEQIALGAEGAHGTAPHLLPAAPANPYRGLLPFEAEHRALFFGRGPEIRAIIEKLRGQPMVLIAGDSGVGKSSVCRAGVLPLVTDGALEDGRLVTVASMVPGKRPLLALASALAPILHLDEKQLARELRSEPALAGQALLAQPTSLLLLVDQLEELLTLSDPGESAAFDRVLGNLLLCHPAARILCTARADFLTRLAMLPHLGPELVRALYLLRPLSREGTREAIVGPARKLGVRFESEELIDTLVSSSTQAPGALPLLQFALAALWEARDQQGKVIPASALAAIGGVAGALAAHADGVLMALPPDQQREARRILTRLVTLEGTRQRRSEAELGAAPATDGPEGDGAHASPATGNARAALEALIRSRLVMARTSEGATFYEVAHEALLSGWATLRGFLDADADQRAVRQRIETAAAEWTRLGRAREALWSERQLQEAAAVDLADLGQQERAFLHASARRHRRLRLLRALLLVGVPLLLLSGYAGLRIKARQDLARLVAADLESAQAALRTARRLDAEAEALQRQAFSAFASARGEQDGRSAWQRAEEDWSRALGRSHTAEDAYRRASLSLEAALSRDPLRADVRRLLADVTVERLRLAERLHDEARTEELRSRLENYDDGSRVRRLMAPARVQLALVPAGAVVSVRRYVKDGYQRRLEPQGRSGDGQLQLLPGSYLLTASAPGHATVRLPVLVAPGEERRITLVLPSEAAVPEGFVYVPPGRFLFGSSEEVLRKGFLSAPPLHEVETAGYLIGRHEVTFAEWLLYLRALPADERARRTPRTAQIQGGLHLSTRGAAYELMLQPRTRGYRAREGEPLRYEGRTRRAVQDWLRFPVSGISFEDGAAYAEWLGRTGRVPRARLCSEHEWERAARGADDRIFPHGDALMPDDANFDETYGRDPLAFGPDEVGAHPQSESPFGIMDLAGNVLEWTRSVQVPGQPVIRGGGWYLGQLSNRSSNREVGEPTERNILIGVRICAPFDP